MTSDCKFPTRNELFGKINLSSLETDDLSWHTDPSLIEISMISSQNILSSAPPLTVFQKHMAAFSF